MGMSLLDRKERFLHCPKDGEVVDDHTFKGYSEVFLEQLRTINPLGILWCQLQTSELVFQCYLDTLMRISTLCIRLKSDQASSTCFLWHQSIGDPSRLLLNPNENQLQFQEYDIHILAFLTHPCQVSQSVLLKSNCGGKESCCKILLHHLQTHGSSQFWGGLPSLV